jgi:hypothetical protein
MHMELWSCLAPICGLKSGDASLSFETQLFRPKMLHFRMIRGPRMGATMDAEHRIDRALKPAL